ncbi:nucleotidyltransferase family protein [Pseudomonas sp. 3A(2025)]
MALNSRQLLDIARTDPINVELIQRLPALGLNQCALVAGCLFQAVWNQQAQQPPGWGIKDYDVFYFDTDLSWEAEDAVIQAAKYLFKDLNAEIEIRNQARVHLWYGEHFGRPYPQLQSTRDGIDRYLIAGTCIGLELESGEVYAPYGLSDVEQGILRLNPLNPEQELFERKAQSYQARWPWLRLEA